MDTGQVHFYTKYIISNTRYPIKYPIKKKNPNKKIKANKLAK